MRVPGHQRRSYAWRWTAALAALAVLVSLTVVWLAGEPEQGAEGATFTVDNLGDTGGQACTSAANDCSLRSAIQLADANTVTDTINFGSLSGTITLGSALPALTAAEATTIDGNGNVTVSGAGGGFDCFLINSAGNTIRDLSVTGCVHGIVLNSPAADGNAIRGNTIFGNSDRGIVSVAGADGNVIGGTTATDRNVIRNNGGPGIPAVDLPSDGNSVTGNCIGTLPDCSTAAPNVGPGVEIMGSNNTVGGTAAGAGNTIAFNAVGVNITGGTNNIVTRNVMFLNTGLGISSVAPAAGLLAGCADAGGGNVACTGTATAAGNIIDLYRANIDAGGPEGDLFLCTAVAGGGGAWGCTFANPGGGSATATERDPGGVNNTSAFSNPVGMPAGPVATDTPTPTPTPSVTNTPTLTPTVTGTPPTATPTKTATPGGPTATPTTGPTELVTLVGGTCSPVISTYADGTAVTTIGGAVSPAGILISIWQFIPASGHWLGYSPQFPQASDLTAVDRLDVIFICVSSAGSFSRPII